MGLTPMQKQYNDIKSKHKDSVLFFRLGDFYEMFGPDAVEASKILNITLTARHKGSPNETPLCGIPYHSADNYISKLTKAGKKVAICEQVSDPSLPGIVNREVIRIITPGTTLDSNILDNKENNYLAALILEKPYGLAFVDLTTGEFKIIELNNQEDLITELNKLKPSEIIISPSQTGNEKLVDKLKNISILNNFEPISNYLEPEEIITEHFKINNLKSFGIENYFQALKAAGFLMQYLQETQKTALKHINKLSYHNITDFMILDQATIRNLDLFVTSYNQEYHGSLLSILDKTLTGMGGRLLRKWLIRPLINKEKIIERLEAVNDFYQDFDLKESIIPLLKEISDLERIVARLGCFRANPRDLIALKRSLLQIPGLKDSLNKSKSKLLKNLSDNLKELPELTDLIENSINDDPPISITEGGIFKPEYNSEIAELRKIATAGKDWIAEFQTKEITKTGINSLKVKYNRVFGYYIEISKSYLGQVPVDYMRKQTLVNAERFTTPELKEYEEKVVGAEEKLKQIENRLFLEIIEQISKYFLIIQNNALIIAKIDVLLNFAQIALNNNYVLPEITDQQIIELKDGRHPVIELINKEKDFIPNDVLLDHIENQLVLLTGPNMSGKSSYLRQVALLTLIAQIGCFVPAKSFKLGVVDRIFTRVGASDNLIYGQSTFMVEMEEAANILNNATEKSLIIFDELGRGTSTYDGLAIAWAIIEYIQKNLQAKTLFATHYHELIEMVEKMEKASNFAVSVLEKEDSVVFLHKVIKGGMDKSYGIEVAKLAGLPNDLITKANQYLETWENGKQNRGQVELFNIQKQESKPENNNKLVIINKLKELNLENLTPLELVQKIKELKDQI